MVALLIQMEEECESLLDQAILDLPIILHNNAVGNQELTVFCIYSTLIVVSRGAFNIRPGNASNTRLTP
jgi:hypothetical protein